jgi:Spy/CpxP family protein refolding chaperone
MKKSLLALMTVGLLVESGIAIEHKEDLTEKHNKCGTFHVQNHDSDPLSGNGDRFLKKLDLSSEQKEQIRLLKKEMLLKIKSSFENRNEFESYFDTNSFNKEAFLRDKGEEYDALINIRADYLDKFYNILTNEQKGKISEILGNIDRSYGKKQKK